MTEDKKHSNAAQQSPSTAVEALEFVDQAVAKLRDLYGQLDALSQRQAELIDAGDAERLLSLLAERQTIVDELASESRSLPARPADWEQIQLACGEIEWKRVKGQLEGIEKMSAAIEERDLADRTRMIEHRDALAGELATMSRGRAAMSAYGSPSKKSPKFQDREG